MEEEGQNQYSQPALFVGNIEDCVVVKIRGFKIAIVSPNDLKRRELEQFAQTVQIDYRSFFSVIECINYFKNENISIDVIVIASKCDINCIEVIRKLIKNTSKVPFIILNKELNENIEYVHFVDSHSIPVVQFYQLFEQCIEELLETTQPVDLITAVELVSCEDDLSFLDSLFEELIEACPILIENIRKSISNNDWPSLLLNSHSIKGAAAQLAAKPLAHAAFIIETAAKNQESKQLEDLIQILEKRFEEVKYFIRNK